MNKQKHYLVIAGVFRKVYLSNRPELSRYLILERVPDFVQRAACRTFEQSPAVISGFQAGITFAVVEKIPRPRKRGECIVDLMGSVAYDIVFLGQSFDSINPFAAEPLLPGDIIMTEYLGKDTESVKTYRLAVFREVREWMPRMFVWNRVCEALRKLTKKSIGRKSRRIFH